MIRLATLATALLRLSAFHLVNSEKSKGVKNVAIIGAGAAGSTTAYYLRQFADEAEATVNITIFEKEDRIGGRTLTIYPYGDRTHPVELGATIFIPLNHILWDNAQKFGLVLRDGMDEVPGKLVVWDGEKFRFEQDEGSWSWWSYAKLFWKYGMAPYRTQKLVQAAVASYLRLYDEPWFPFRSLTERAYALGLVKLTGMTGQQYLEANKVSQAFSEDIIQAATRVNYASNLAFIHGLDSMVSMAPDDAVQVVGGNWQIFSIMVNQSGAALNKETTVTSIDVKSGTGDGESPPKYSLRAKMTGSDETGVDEYPVAFDDVVVATPWQFSDIVAGDGTIQHMIDKIPYVTLHVTLFTSPHRLSPEFFGLAPGSKAPTTVLTTLSPGEEAKPGSAAAGKVGFYSVSTLSMITNPTTGQQEYTYKIFSPDVVTPDLLSRLLGVKIPETFTGSTTPDTQEAISWYHPHVFQSYPVAYPRVTFQDPIVGRGVYYTAGIESFISCMETNALMGKNVARLIVDDITGKTPSGESGQKVDGGENPKTEFTGMDMGEL